MGSNVKLRGIDARTLCFDWRHLQLMSLLRNNACFTLKFSARMLLGLAIHVHSLSFSCFLRFQSLVDSVRRFCGLQNYLMRCM